MSSAKVRLARLESKTGGNGYMHVIKGPADGAYNVDALLKAAGKVQGPSDLVVYLNEFGENPPAALVSPYSDASRCHANWQFRGGFKIFVRGVTWHCLPQLVDKRTKMVGVTPPPSN